MGDSIHNPQTGQRITFLRTGHETGGKLLRMEFVMDPAGFVAAEHIHPRQEERFEVLAGKVRMRVDGNERDVAVGEVVVVPPGHSHMWWNPGNQPARVLAELRPALRTEEFLRTLYAWAAEGKTRDGMPANPLLLAVIAREYRAELRAAPKADAPLTRLPARVQDGVVLVLAALGRLFGLSARTDHRAP